jgi:hypothetical protein
MSGLYRLSVGISLKDSTKQGFADIERNAANTQKKADALRKSLEALGKGFDPQHSLASQMKINEYTEKQVALRKQMALSTDASERKRIGLELQALSLAKQEETIRKSQLSLQERLGKLQDQNAFQAQASQEKLEQQAIRNQEDVAEVTLRNQRRMAEETYRAQVEQERRDLASIRMISRYKMQAIREQEREQERANARQAAAQERRRAGRAQFNAGAGILGAMAASAAGAGILNFEKGGLVATGTMQTAETTLQVATGATSSQMKRLHELAFTVAANTGQSVSDTMGNFAILASSGLGGANQIAQLATPAIKYADIQYFKTGGKVSFQESIDQVATIAHQLGAYTPQAMLPILEKLNRLSFAMPNTMRQVSTQLGYFAPIFKSVGVPVDQTIEAAGLLSRAGLLRGKGGSSLANFLHVALGAGVMPGTLLNSKQERGLRDFGLVDKSGRSRYLSYNSATGKTEFDFNTAFKHVIKGLNDIPAGMKGQAAADWRAMRIGEFNKTFGLVGSRAAEALTPEGLQNLTDSLSRAKEALSLDELQSKYMDNIVTQEKRFTASLQTMSVALMAPWIGRVTAFISNAATQLDHATAWLNKHPKEAEGIAYDLTAIGTALSFGGVVFLGEVAVNLGKCATGLAALDVAARSFPGVGGGISGGAPGRAGGLPRFDASGKLIPEVGSVAPKAGILGTVAALAAAPEVLIGLAVIVAAGASVGLTKYAIDRDNAVLHDRLRTQHERDQERLHGSDWLNDPRSVNQRGVPQNVDSHEDHSIQFHGVTFNVQGATGRAQADDLMKQLNGLNVQQALRTGGAQPGPTLSRLSLLH